MQKAGLPSYWLVDPVVPHVTVLELHDGAYEVVAEVGPGEQVELSAPFPVRLAPDELCD